MLTNIENTDLTGYTAVVACPSVGSVGQLTVDLLINNLRAEKLGSFWHEAVLPFAGPDPFSTSSNHLSTGCDVYASPEKGVVLLQVRSSVRKQLQRNYLTEVVDFFKARGVKQYIVLSGMYSNNRRDADLNTGKLRYFTNKFVAELCQEYEKRLQDMEWLWLVSDKCSSEGFPSTPGTGFVKRLFEVCDKESIPCTALLYYCMEGDNTVESLELFKHVNKLLSLQLNDNTINLPCSWSNLFGSGPPKELY